MFFKNPPIDFLELLEYLRTPSRESFGSALLDLFARPPRDKGVEQPVFSTSNYDLIMQPADFAARAWLEPELWLPEEEDLITAALCGEEYDRESLIELMQRFFDGSIHERYARRQAQGTQEPPVAAEEIEEIFLEGPQLPPTPVLADHQVDLEKVDKWWIK